MDGIRCGSNVISSQMAAQLSSTILLKSPSVLQWVTITLFLYNTTFPCTWVYFQISFCSSFSFVYLNSVPHCLNYRDFIAWKYEYVMSWNTSGVFSPLEYQIFWIFLQHVYFSTWILVSTCLAPLKSGDIFWRTVLHISGSWEDWYLLWCLMVHQRARNLYLCSLSHHGLTQERFKVCLI